MGDTERPSQSLGDTLAAASRPRHSPSLRSDRSPHRFMMSSILKPVERLAAGCAGRIGGTLT